MCVFLYIYVCIYIYICMCLYVCMYYDYISCSYNNTNRGITVIKYCISFMIFSKYPAQVSLLHVYSMCISASIAIDTSTLYILQNMIKI